MGANIPAPNIRALNIPASNIQALNIQALNTRALNIPAWRIRALSNPAWHSLGSPGSARRTEVSRSWDRRSEKCLPSPIWGCCNWGCYCLDWRNGDSRNCEPDKWESHSPA